MSAAPAMMVAIHAVGVMSHRFKIPRSHTCAKCILYTRVMMDATIIRACFRRRRGLSRTPMRAVKGRRTHEALGGCRFFSAFGDESGSVTDSPLFISLPSGMYRGALSIIAFGVGNAPLFGVGRWSNFSEHGSVLTCSESLAAPLVFCCISSLSNSLSCRYNYCNGKEGGLVLIDTRITQLAAERPPNGDAVNHRRVVRFADTS
jgi:hypothetical protein